HERGRRDRRHAVDADGDLERELLQLEALLVRVRLGGRIRRTERARERDGLPEADVDLPVAPAERAGEAEKPAEALALLLRAALLRGVAGDVLDLVVRDRDGHEQHVVALPAPVRVDHVGEEAEPRRHELPRPRASALDVPLEREALLDEIVDVLAKDELVDLV